jgi:hypothetical protein
MYTVGTFIVLIVLVALVGALLCAIAVFVALLHAVAKPLAEALAGLTAKRIPSFHLHVGMQAARPHSAKPS